jgi:rRNA processing protein Krr1/Pno1
MSLVSLIIKDGANALFPQDEGYANSSMHSMSSMHSASDYTGGMGFAINDFGLSSDGTTLTTETRCPFSKVGTLIGVKGYTIAEIMRRSGCRVHVIQDPPGDGNLNERQVVYCGTEEQIMHAQGLVATVLNEGSSSLRPAALLGMMSELGPKMSGLGLSPNAVKEEDDIDPDKVGIVIGVKGSVISEIMRRTGCKIVINQDFPPGVPHRVIYVGDPEQIEMARGLVEAVLSRGPATVTDPNGATSPIIVEEMDIYQSQTGKILGPQGSTIKEIQVRCGVKMSIQVSPGAQAGDHMAINKLRLTGTAEGIRTAVESVCRVLNGGSTHGNGPVSPRIGGSVTSSAPRSNGMMMGLGPDGSSGVLEPPQVLPDGMHQQTAEIKNEVMGKVIGKCSGNISLIKSKSGANVQVMKSSVVDRSGSTRVVIIGTPSDVHLATQMVQEVLVNGPAKLLLMPDKQQSVPSHYRGLPSTGSGHGSLHGGGSLQGSGHGSIGGLGVGGFGRQSISNASSSSDHGNGFEMMLMPPLTVVAGMGMGGPLSNHGMLMRTSQGRDGSSGSMSSRYSTGGLMSSRGASMGFGLAQPTVIGAHLEPTATSSNTAMLMGGGEGGSGLFVKTNGAVDAAAATALTPQQFYSNSLASLKASDMVPQQYAGMGETFSRSHSQSAHARGSGQGHSRGSEQANRLMNSSSNPFDYATNLQDNISDIQTIQQPAQSQPSNQPPLLQPQQFQSQSQSLSQQQQQPPSSGSEWGSFY